MKKLSLLFGILSLILLAITATAVASTSMHGVSLNNPIGVRGCVIRFDTKSADGKSVVPRIYTDANHHCVGVTSVVVDKSGGWSNGTLRVNNTGGSNNFVTFIAEEDETLTKKGIACGGSGGGVLTVISCYDRTGKFIPADSLDMFGAGANLWLLWMTWEG